MKYQLLLFSFLFVCVSFGQTSFEHSQFKVKKIKTIDPKNIESGYNAQILHLEAPLPGGDSYRSFLMQQKTVSKAFFKNYNNTKKNQLKTNKNAPAPEVGFELHPKRILPNGFVTELFAGIPSDNTVAISNDGIALIGMNKLLYAYDINKDTAVFEDQYITLKDFVDGFSSSNYYDPKIIYDPEEDRFIVACLKDNTPDDSQLFVCFSSSSDINDEWYVYSIPGNPLNNNRWTDFPAISITEDKLYYTGNLIIPNVSWQVGFDGSVIWEIDKHKGYAGDDDINAGLYSGITYNNAYIRNLHAVQGADGLADDAIFLSNRNFDILNDTIFFLQLEDGNLEITPLKSNVPYGVPPNARQADTDTSDAGNGLQTNDARVLGAIKFEDEIQFVGNTIYPPTGFSAIYHGTITDLNNNPQVFGHIIADTVKDYGYPNIAWVGNEKCDIETIIGFNSSSFDHFPSIEATYFSNEGEYSDVILVKEGLNYVNRLPGSYERWGDYFGLQRMYNEPGRAMSFGFLALENQGNGGYLAELISPDSSQLRIDFETEYSEVCNNSVTATITQGTPPFTYYWNNDTIGTSSNSISGICPKDSIELKVTDSRGCSKTKQYRVPVNPSQELGKVYPNPATDLLAFRFTIEEDMEVTAEIFDLNGKKVDIVSTLPAKSGLNEYVFSIAPLSPGNYQLVLSNSEKVIEKFRFVKGK